MYFFLYDAFLREKKYETTLARIEGRLLDLGLSGKSEKLTILKSMKEVVQTALKRGADTIVAVGDDQTLSRLMGIVADANVAVGYIPLGRKTAVAASLGIPTGMKACDVLSTRLIERLDLGKANTTYFLSFLALSPGKDLFIECDHSYHIEPLQGQHALSVFNFGYGKNDPRDGVLEVVLEETRKGIRKRGWLSRRSNATSVFPVRHMRIKSFGVAIPAYADGQTVVKTPMTIEVIPKKLRMIVGKNRNF